ncbi:MAG TPA: nitrate reductase associated protein [Candidatus Binataceae bacterium]|nr:nitrate reductase associated protein [Candidatus Binataceae bacterium]
MEKHHYEFERQLNADLSCPPLAARQKLDALRIKVSRNQWLSLEMHERRAINDMPADSAAEREHFAEFVRSAVKARSGEPPSELSKEQQVAAVPTEDLPAILINRARELGFQLDASAWQRLDYDQRYALLKFGSDERRRRKFAAALKEFLANT